MLEQSSFVMPHEAVKPLMAQLNLRRGQESAFIYAAIHNKCVCVCDTTCCDKERWQQYLSILCIAGAAALAILRHILSSFSYWLLSAL